MPMEYVTWCQTSPSHVLPGPGNILSPLFFPLSRNYIPTVGHAHLPTSNQTFSHPAWTKTSVSTNESTELRTCKSEIQVSDQVSSQTDGFRVNTAIVRHQITHRHESHVEQGRKQPVHNICSLCYGPGTATYGICEAQGQLKR